MDIINGKKTTAGATVLLIGLALSSGADEETARELVGQVMTGLGAAGTVIGLIHKFLKKFFIK